jgi:hypothetical protein
MRKNLLGSLVQIISRPPLDRAHGRPFFPRCRVKTRCFLIKASNKKMSMLSTKSTIGHEPVNRGVDWSVNSTLTANSSLISRFAVSRPVSPGSTSPPGVAQKTNVSPCLGTANWINRTRPARSRRIARADRRVRGVGISSLSPGQCQIWVKATLTPPCSLAFVAAPPPTRRFTFEPTHTNQQTAKHCNIAEVGRHVRAGRKHERAENQQPREDGKNHPTLPGTGNAPTPSIAFRWEPIFRASRHEHLLGLGRGDINADMARPFLLRKNRHRAITVWLKSAV